MMYMYVSPDPLFFTERCFLIFWPEENAVKAVPESKLMEPDKQLPTGAFCRVKIRGVVYAGQAVATGKCAVFNYVWTYCT